MFWNMIAGFAQGWNHGDVTRAQAKANNLLADVNAEAKNKVRVAQNAEVAARNNLSRWIQSVNNNRALDAGGDALEANIVNFRRQEDAAMVQDFSSGISAAEQEGAAAAAAAVAGVDGQVVDMVNSSMALRNSIVQQQVADYRGMQKYDTLSRAGNIMSQMIGGLDQSIILDTLDYNVDVAQHEAIISRLAYGLRGMAEHMGGGGAINSGYDQQRSQNQQRLAENERQAEKYAEQQRRDTEYAETSLKGNPRAQGQFMYKYGADNDQEYNPYSLWQPDREREQDDDSAKRNNFISW